MMKCIVMKLFNYIHWGYDINIYNCLGFYINIYIILLEFEWTLLFYFMITIYQNPQCGC